MAYTLPVIMIGGCWFLRRHRQNDDYIDYFAVSLRLIGALALILTSCGLAAINTDDIWYFASGAGRDRQLAEHRATADAPQ